MADDLERIQRLQFSDIKAAEEETRVLLEGVLETPVRRASLQVLPTSLNSFNGFASTDKEELFFKSHTEPGGAIKEYYNANIMDSAGYNVVLPVHAEHKDGEQIAFYPVVKWPVMFDLMRQAEREETPVVNAEKLIEAEKNEGKKLLEIYQATAERTNATENAEAPIHQLFWHRLTGGRFEQFYSGRDVQLPNGKSVPMSQVLDARWTINGVSQPRTLNELVTEATTVLDPKQDALTVIGHGDAHFGNVFLEDQKDFLYFDPAFAGRHSPQLDVVKPLFHNVFAQWMYFPEEKANEISTNIDINESDITVCYSNAFTPFRMNFLEEKTRTLIDPTIAWLEDQDALPHGRRQLELALMCCPLLTMNLTDQKKFPPSMSWVGLALAMQMGNWDNEQIFTS